MATISDIGTVRVNDLSGKYLRGFESLPLPQIIEHFTEAVESMTPTIITPPSTTPPSRAAKPEPGGFIRPTIAPLPDPNVGRRHDAWPELMHEHIKSKRDASFAWSTNDCCTWVADHIQLVTGVDLYTEFRGLYHDSKSAFVRLRCAGKNISRGRPRNASTCARPLTAFVRGILAAVHNPAQPHDPGRLTFSFGV